jgi:hypothetical protein
MLLIPARCQLGTLVGVAAMLEEPRPQLLAGQPSPASHPAHFGPLASGLVQEIGAVQMLYADFLPIVGFVAHPRHTAACEDQVVAHLAHDIIDAGAGKGGNRTALE